MSKQQASKVAANKRGAHFFVIGPLLVVVGTILYQSRFLINAANGNGSIAYRKRIDPYLTFNSQLNGHYEAEGNNQSQVHQVAQQEDIIFNKNNKN